MKNVLRIAEIKGGNIKGRVRYFLRVLCHILLFIAFVLFIDKEGASFVVWLWLQSQCSGPLVGRFGSQMILVVFCEITCPKICLLITQRKLSQLQVYSGILE